MIFIIKQQICIDKIEKPEYNEVAQREECEIMGQKTLSKWLKAVIIGVGLCGLAVFFFIIPYFGQSLVEQNPEFSGWFWPWLIFIWVCGVPCYAVLVLIWKIATKISKNKSFSMENAAYLKWISWIAAIDTALFFAGNVVMMLLNMSHPGVLIGMFILSIFGIAITVAAALLSHLVRKAAALQEESDLTI